MKKILLSSIVALSLNAAGFLVLDNDKSLYFTMNSKQDKVDFISGMKILKNDVCISCDDFISTKSDFSASKAQASKYDSISVSSNDGAYKIRYLIGANKKELDLNNFFANYLTTNNTLEISEDVIYIAQDLTSVRFHLIEDSKGAHPLHFSQYAILDKNSDVITADFAFKNQEKLKTQIEKKLRKYQKNIKHPEKDNKFLAPLEIGNFYFDNLGIVFAYNPYDLFSYSSGYIKVRLKYKEIKPFLSNEFLQLLKDNKIIKP